jgi:tetratricopeptide (TPR) repeat protein
LTRPRYEYTWSWKDKEETIPDLQYGGDKIHTRFGYRWKHPVHEVITSDRVEETIGWVGLQIHHHPDHSKPRSQYMPLLELSVREDPLDDRNAHYYARELFFHGKFIEAKKEFIRHLSLPNATWKPERAASMRYIAKCSVGEEKEKWFIKAVEEAPGRRESLVDLAEYYYHQQKWESCLYAVEKTLSIAEKPLEYLCEEKAWGSFPYDIGSIAAFSLKKYELALKFGEEALKLSPNDERIKKNLEFFNSSVKE